MENDGLYHHPLEGFSQKEYEQFLDRLGRLTFNIPMASMLARHRWPLNTVRDYVDIYPTDDKITKAAKQYLVDLVKMTTPELAQKWRNDAFPDDETWFHAVKHDQEVVRKEAERRRQWKSDVIKKVGDSL